MYLTRNASQTGSTRSGQQMAGGLFLMLFSDQSKHGRQIRAAVRSVRMTQAGHFMGGIVKLGGYDVYVEGHVGSNGLPISADKYDGLWEKLVPVPTEIADVYWATEHGGDSALRQWAKANLAQLQKAGRKIPAKSKKRRAGKPSYETIKRRRLERAAAKHGIKLTAKDRREALFKSSSKFPLGLDLRAEELDFRRRNEYDARFGGTLGREVFDPRDVKGGQAFEHDRFMKLKRPALPNHSPDRAKNGRFKKSR